MSQYDIQFAEPCSGDVVCEFGTSFPEDVVHALQSVLMDRVIPEGIRLDINGMSESRATLVVGVRPDSAPDVQAVLSGYVLPTCWSLMADAPSTIQPSGRHAWQPVLS